MSHKKKRIKNKRQLSCLLVRKPILKKVVWHVAEEQAVTVMTIKGRVLLLRGFPEDTKNRSQAVIKANGTYKISEWKCKHSN